MPAGNGTFVEYAEDLSDLILQIKRVLHGSELAKQAAAKQEQALKDGLFGARLQLSARLRLLPYFLPPGFSSRRRYSGKVVLCSVRMACARCFQMREANERIA